MLELISTNSEQTIGFAIAGKIESDDIDLVTNAIEEKLKTHDKLRIYAEIDKMQGISVKAFIKDLNFALKHFRDFDKEAIVADGKWWQKFAALGNKLAPATEVKYFSFADKERALQWIDS